jgi:hypothetical protein
MLPAQNLHVNNVCIQYICAYIHIYMLHISTYLWYIYIYNYIYTYIYDLISEVGGSEFAFRQGSP